MPLTEAMACGVPIIASDIPVHREILQGAGVMVPPHDVEAMANAFYSVLTNGHIRSQLSHAALARGKAFTWSETARQTMLVYEQASRLAEEKRGWRKSL